jgi:hypothetical protein
VQDAGRDQVGLGDGGQPDEDHAVGMVGDQPLGGRQGQPRLADAGRASEGREAHVAPTQPAADRRDLLITSDEGGDGRGQVRDGVEVPFGSGERAAPTVDRTFQCLPVTVRQAEGLHEEVDGLPVRGAPRPAFEVADGAHA